MDNYMLKVNYFYNTIIEFIEKGIQEKKYFYNSRIFENEQTDDVINKQMHKNIMKAISKIVSTSEGQTLYLHAISEKYNDNSRIYVTKEIVRVATLEYYKDQIKQTGTIDINMDIHNLNISQKTIEILKEKLCISNDIVTLKDILNISVDDSENWIYAAGNSKREINDLLKFSNDIYSIIVQNSTNKELLTQIKELDNKRLTIHNQILQLEKQEQSIINSIKNLKVELFKANGVDNKTNIKR